MRVLASACVALVAAAAAAGARASDCSGWLPVPPAVPTLVASTVDPAWQAAVVFPNCTVETVVVGSTNKDLTFVGTIRSVSLEAVVSVPTELEAISFDQIGWFTAANFTNAKHLKSLSCRNARLPIINNSTLPDSITSLSMIGNEIVSLRNATLPPALEDLNLGLNNITVIDFELPKTLKTLVLSNNRITALDRVSFPSTLQVLVLKNTNITVVRGTRLPKPLTSLQIEPWTISTFEIQETDFMLLSKISFLSINASQTSCDEPSAQIKTLGTNSFCVISDAKFTELYGAQTPEPATQAPQIAENKSNSVVVIVVVCVAAVLVLGCGFAAYRVYTRSQARRRKQDGSPVGEGYVLEQVSSGSKPSGVSGGGSDGAHYLYNDVRNDPTLLPLRLNEQEVELKESLAHGGFGVVYRAIYRGQEVAIKRVLPELSQDVSKLTRFMDEIRLCASLDHSKIVAFKGVCWTSLRDLSAVIEYMPGGDLHSVLSRESSTPSPSDWMESWTPAHINAKSSIALDVAEAVVYLHSFASPILHRDLKARNVLLDERGNAKLSDFGISRELSPEETMTRGIGTVAWMAPEVLMGERYTEKADIYSLGVLLVELDRCRDPYADQLQQDGQPIGETQLAVLVSQGKIRPSLSADAPESVRWLVDQCLSFDALSRPSAMAVFYALHQICRAVNEHE